MSDGVGADFFRKKLPVVGTSPMPIVPSMYRGKRDDDGHDMTFDEKRSMGAYGAF
ncbi:MAG: hypothetical protein ABIT47_01205 [Candidatus Paceibacterota bacterium]